MQPSVDKRSRSPVQGHGEFYLQKRLKDFLVNLVPKLVDKPFSRVFPVELAKLLLPSDFQYGEAKPYSVNYAQRLVSQDVEGGSKPVQSVLIVKSHGRFSPQEFILQTKLPGKLEYNFICWKKMMVEFFNRIIINMIAARQSPNIGRFLDDDWPDIMLHQLVGCSELSHAAPKNDNGILLHEISLGDFLD